MKKKPLSKVIPLHEGHFSKPDKRPLSKLMIASLVSACKKQLNGIPFGQPDIDGSFSALVSRGLIKYKHDNIVNGKIQPTWVVTEQAFEILRNLGIKIE